jgi:cyanobactin maturation PatA/PatG family protease
VSAAEDRPDGESIFEDLRTLRREVRGDPEVCVAVLDGPVDLSHPCFRGGDLTRVGTLAPDVPGAGAMSGHGTHVASIIFGQPSSGTLGVAARCRGLLLTVFRDSSGYLSQLDLARAIERAVLEGAHVINVSGGERAPRGQPDPLLARALALCENSNVLVVAAAGNDGCDCLHVPAAVAPALAVGAMDRTGAPVESSNFGDAYRQNGVLAPGKGIPGAVPGGGIVAATGSSFATPIVSGLAALLMSVQKREIGSVDARAVRRAILDSAIPCQQPAAAECARYLAGSLNIPGAYDLIRRGGRSQVAELDTTFAETAEGGRRPAPWEASLSSGAGVAASAAASGWENAAPPAQAHGAPEPPPSTPPVATAAVQGSAPSAAPPPPPPPPPPPQGIQGQYATLGATSAAPASFGGVGPGTDAAGGVGPSSGCGHGAPCSCGAAPSAEVPLAAVPVAPVPALLPVPISYVYAIGNIGFDFGTEARRDTFRALMPTLTIEGSSPPIQTQPNPYDARQLADYLERDPWESTKVIWTLNLELTPVYALEAEPEYADAVYELFRQALRHQSLPADDPLFVSRVSIPGVLTTRTVRLYSGQVVPVVEVQRRGTYVWNEAALVDAVVAAVPDPTADSARVRRKVRQMLDKVYYQMRNLGQSPPDRAINFQATNAFVFAAAIADGILSGKVERDDADLYSLDTITAVKSPYCRVDSDCWDVQISFFDPDNDQRATVVFQSTIDVSDQLPVQLAPTHQFLFRN